MNIEHARELINAIQTHYIGEHGDIVIVTKAGARFLIETDRFHLFDQAQTLVFDESVFIPLESIDCIYKFSVDREMR